MTTIEREARRRHSRRTEPRVFKWDRLHGDKRPHLPGLPVRLDKDTRNFLKQFSLASGLQKIRGGAADQLYVFTINGVATSTSAKTLLELAPPSAAAGSGAIAVCEWWIEFNGSATGLPLTVEFLRVTATTGITGTSVSGQKYAEEITAATACTTKHTATAEGTITVTEFLQLHYIPPTGGIYVQFPLGREPDVVPGTNRYFRLRVTGSTGVTPSAALGLVWSE